MKKSIVLTVLALSIFAISGCTNKTAPKPALSCLGDASNPPKWVCGSAQVEGIYAIGSSEKMPTISMQRTKAQSNGRDELARTIEVKVQNMLKDYASSTGVGADQTAEAVFTTVSKQVSKQTLTGARPLEWWTNPTNQSMYVLMVLDNNAKNVSQVQQAVKTSLQNEKALWQEFKAKKAHDELDAAISKEFGN
jgi:hypothetical protein